MESTEITECRRANRVALVGDTHDTIVGSEVFGRLAPHLTGVDLILHCGDLSSADSLDTLSAVAPLLAVRSTTDPEANPPRLVEGPRQVIAAAGWRIEVRNKLPPEEVTDRDDVDVVVYSAHQPAFRAVGSTLYVSPGSPALSKSPSIAELDLRGDTPLVLFRMLRTDDSDAPSAPENQATGGTTIV